jgi:hypothetical protein
LLEKPGASVKCPAGQEAYCALLDQIEDRTNAELDCPAVKFPELFVGSGEAGYSSYGVEPACVKEKLEKTLEFAESVLPHDRNLDWIAGALALTENCVREREYPQYCDASDLVNRNAFVSDLLNELKTGPSPIEFKTSIRVIFSNEDISLSPSAEDKTSGASEEMIWGEFWVEKFNIERYPEMAGKFVVGRRDQNMLYSTPFSGTLYDFAQVEMDGKCAQKGGTLVTDASEGPGAPHVGALDLMSEVKVFYLGSCNLSKLGQAQ